MRSIVTACVACSTLVVPAAWGANTVTATASLAEVDTILTTPVTQRVDTFSTELRARMVTGGFLYDQTFAVAFSDPAVQAAITTAKGVLTGAGAVSFNGPFQFSNSQSLVSSNANTVINNTALSQSILNTEVFVGPQTISTGNFGLCQSYTLDGSGHPVPAGCVADTPPKFPPFPGPFPFTSFSIVPGGVDVDTLALQLVTINQTTTTTNTFLTTQVYEVDGFPQGVTATPAPPTLMLGLIGLTFVGAFLARQRFARSRS